MIDLKVLFISGLLIEVITIIARFMFKQSSKKTYISLMMGKRLKYFIHLHHGITGIIICAVTYILGQSLLFNIGLGMIFQT